MKHATGRPNKGTDVMGVQFLTKAAILPFDRLHVQLPAEHRSRNDAVRVADYEPAELPYTGKQRRCIHGGYDTCPSMRDHVVREPMEPFPLSVETQRPQGAFDAASFCRGCSPDKIRSFWNSQMWMVGKLVQDSDLAHRMWGEAIPDGVKPAVGRLETVSAIHLMQQCGIRGQKWLRQFAHGAPIDGELSQRFAYKAGGKHQAVLPRSRVYEDDSVRRS